MLRPDIVLAVLEVILLDALLDILVYLVDVFFIAAESIELKYAECGGLCKRRSIFVVVLGIILRHFIVKALWLDACRGVEIRLGVVERIGSRSAAALGAHQHDADHCGQTQQGYADQQIDNDVGDDRDVAAVLYRSDAVLYGQGARAVLSIGGLRAVYRYGNDIFAAVGADIVGHGAVGVAGVEHIAEVDVIEELGLDRQGKDPLVPAVSHEVAAAEQVDKLRSYLVRAALADNAAIKIIVVLAGLIYRALGGEVVGSVLHAVVAVCLAVQKLGCAAKTRIAETGQIEIDAVYRILDAVGYAYLDCACIGGHLIYALFPDSAADPSAVLEYRAVAVGCAGGQRV